MRAGQKLIADDGKEVALFPMEYIYMTQDEGGDYSHLGTYNIDMVGYNGSQVIYQAPIYAPVTMRLVFTSMSYAGGNTCTFVSVDKVHLADGSLDYLTINFSHDSNPPITQIGTIVEQGDLCYHTGSYGYVTGDHVHTCCGLGQYIGDRAYPPNGNYALANQMHYWNAVYINDTPIINGFGHPWAEYQGGHPPTPPVEYNKGKYNFVLFNRRKRQEKWIRTPLNRRFKS